MSYIVSRLIWICFPRLSSTMQPGTKKTITSFMYKKMISISGKHLIRPQQMHDSLPTANKRRFSTVSLTGFMKVSEFLFLCNKNYSVFLHSVLLPTQRKYLARITLSGLPTAVTEWFSLLSTTVKLTTCNSPFTVNPDHFNINIRSPTPFVIQR